MAAGLRTFTNSSDKVADKPKGLGLPHCGVKLEKRSGPI